MELADTSAWIVSRRASRPALHAEFRDGLLAGAIATCDMVRFELLRSVRNAREFAEVAAELSLVPDCRITGQPNRWIVARGSL